MTEEDAIKILQDVRDRTRNSRIIEAICTLHPELRESEDERMCTRCIELLRKVSAYSGEEYLGVEIADCIIWLQALRKKQKEHQNNSDAPKEKSVGGDFLSSHKDKNLDEIAQDYVNGVKEYNPEPTWDLMQTAVCYGYHLVEQKPVECITDSVKFDEGFKTGHEIGFHEGVDSVKPVEWSEDDIENGSYISAFLQANCENNEILKKATTWFMSRFKSLYPVKQEWSEEDEKMLDSVIRIISQFDGLAHEPTYAGPKWTHPYTKELAWLKSLRPSWKPSEEQMSAFRGYIEDFQAKAEAAVGGWNNFDVMIRLYEQLKKLM